MSNKLTGKQILDVALKHIGEEYILGTVVPKNDPSWDGPWDCAEFVSWCVYQAAKILYGCSDNDGDPAVADAYTGFWGRDARTIGKRIEVKEAAGIPGAAVLRLGSPGHVVISDGKGGTVEAAGSRTGVIRHTLNNRRWDMGILVPGVSYNSQGQVTPEPVEGIVYRLTNPYMSGSVVWLIQGALQSRGYYLSGPDGVYGPVTTAAVRKFQQDRGIVPDGEVGPLTFKELGIS